MPNIKEWIKSMLSDWCFLALLQTSGLSDYTSKLSNILFLDSVNAKIKDWWNSKSSNYRKTPPRLTIADSRTLVTVCFHNFKLTKIASPNSSSALGLSERVMGDREEKCDEIREFVDICKRQRKPIRRLFAHLSWQR